MTAFLAGQLADCETGWSLGAFGAIAEFTRDAGEPADQDNDGNAVSVVTARGGIRLEAARRAEAVRIGIDDARKLEPSRLALPSRGPLRHGPPFRAHRAWPRHTGASRRGPRRSPVRSRPRLPAGRCLHPRRRSGCRGEASHACRPSCVRAGQSGDGHRRAGESASRVHQPHRPHRGVPADPAAQRQEPGRSAHSRAAEAPSPRPHAFRDRAGAGGLRALRAFLSGASDQGRARAGAAVRRAASRCFQRMLRLFGDPGALMLKQRVIAAIGQGGVPSDIVVPNDRFARASVRVAIRQMRMAGEAPPALAAWAQALDHGQVDIDEDDADPHHGSSADASQGQDRHRHRRRAVARRGHGQRPRHGAALCAGGRNRDGGRPRSCVRGRDRRDGARARRPCVAFEADVTKEATLAAMVASAHKQFGRIDVLHYNVGVSIAGGDAPPTEITEEAFDRVAAINLRGCVMAVKHVLPVMRAQKSGVILTISSLAAYEVYPYVAYKATKAAMIAFTQQVAIQNASYGIRANSILPGLMDTPMAVDTRARTTGKPRAEVAAARDAKVPLRGKMGTAWDVANAALFLASDEANFITGVALPVDGGALVNIG